MNFNFTQPTKRKCDEAEALIRDQRIQVIFACAQVDISYHTLHRYRTYLKVAGQRVQEDLMNSRSLSHSCNDNNITIESYYRWARNNPELSQLDTDKDELAHRELFGINMEDKYLIDVT